ncbi:MAG: hypothetical protein AMXMBFR4_09230 [Candidatus Hydrogenedentota bacterium]
MIRNGFLLAAILTLLAASCAAHRDRERSEAELPPLPSDSKPRPEFFNHPYGPHERNVLDLWQAQTAKPSPVLVFFHGGGFVGGDKWTLDPDLLERCLEAGISVCSANYRYSTQQPFPGPMLDGARVVQYLRANARRFHIDPRRIAVSGSSAGSGISLWMAFHDDLADPSSDDPVVRQSSRVSCAGVWGAQCSYDPRFVKEVIGGRAYEHPALPVFYGLSLAELDSPKAYRLYEAAAPITYVSKDDPPVMLYYVEPKDPLPPGPNRGPSVYYADFGKELDGQDRPGEGIHHPKFGEVLKEHLDPLGVECVLRHRDDYRGKANPDKEFNKEFVGFLIRHFHMAST